MWNKDVFEEYVSDESEKIIIIDVLHSLGQEVQDLCDAYSQEIRGLETYYRLSR